MNAIRLADNIFWVGKVDDRKVPFHRLILEREQRTTVIF